MKKIILTGPTGSIGHALIEACLADSIAVYAICRPDSPRSASLPQHSLMHLVQADLANLSEAGRSLPNDCDVFYHFGWAGTFGADVRNDMFMQTKNIQFTLDAVDLAHQCGCHTFIGAGSQAEYGRFEGKLKADTSAFPENGYGMAKLCAGQMSRVQAHKYGMKHVWTRILSVYGPYDGARTMVMSTILKLLNGEKPAFTKGEQMWDYLYAKDAGQIMLELGSEKSRDGHIYCLGSGKVQPLRTYIETIRDAINPALRLGLGEVPYGPKQVMYLCADNSDLINDLDYHYQYDFAAGIKETIAWVKANLQKQV